MLRTPRTFAEIARVGPIAHQGRTIDATLRDPRRPAVVAVALPEEMPVNETLALQRAAARGARASSWRRSSSTRVPAATRLGAAAGVARSPERARGERTPRDRVRARRAARPAPAPSTRARAPSASRSRGCADGLGEQPLELPYLVGRPGRAGRSPTRSTSCWRATASPGRSLVRSPRLRRGRASAARRARSTASASASAAAPAASARRRPRPRSRWGWRRAGEGRGRDDRPGAAAGERARARRARQRAAPRRPRALRRRRAAARRRRAVGDDARPQAHVRRADRAARARRRARATRSSPTASTASCRARSPARRSSPRSRSCTSSTASGDFDLLVLDTPPSRNALDFLDAPDRLTQLLRGPRAAGVAAPSGARAAPARPRHRASCSACCRRVTGVDLLSDLSTFFRAARRADRRLPRARAEQVEALLRDPATTFLLVTSPEREPIEEAIFFRASCGGADAASAARSSTACTSTSCGDEARRRPVRRLLERRPASPPRSRGSVAAALRRRARARARATPRTSRTCAERLGADVPLLLVPHLDDDVHDVEGLVRIGRHLFAEATVGSGGDGLRR